MRNSRWIAVVWVAIFAVFASVLAAEGERTETVRRALLIGINDYAANDRPDPSGGKEWIPADLRGAINDLEKMRAVLTSRFGFKSSEIRTLADREATREVILNAMREIVRASGPDDVVYIHFSGHGSQVADTDGDETDDDFDETILPHDARTGAVPDITDDEIGEILSRLKTRHALIVLDSCHSGTATREVSAIRTRMVAPDPRVKLYVRKQVATRSAIPAGAEYVLMTGAAEHQAALDGPLDGKFYGLFSYALGKAMANAPARATPRDIHASVLKEFERIAAHFGLMGMPDPQLEGSTALAGRAVLRPADRSDETESSSARLAWAEVRPAAGGTAILVQAVPLGAQPGATWAVYPPGETAFLLGRALAIAMVTETRGDDAVVRVEAAGAPLRAGCRAVALAPPPASGRVPIRIDRAEPEMRAGVERALARLSTNVQFVAPGEFARFIVDLESGMTRVYGALGIQQVASFEADGAEQISAKIADLLTRSASASALLTLDNPASALQLDVRVAPAGPNGTTRGVMVVAAADTPAYRIRRGDEPRSAETSLMLDLMVSRDSFVTVVDVDTEGGINILFPNASTKEGFYPEGKLPGGRVIRLPDSLRSANRAGFFWDYQPPAGLDTLRVFAMSERESALRLRAYIDSLKPAPATRGEGGARPRPWVAFNDLARELAGKVTTRGIAVVPDDGKAEADRSSDPDWTAASLTLVIED